MNNAFDAEYAVLIPACIIAADRESHTKDVNMFQLTAIIGALILGSAGYLIGRKLTADKRKSVVIGIIVFFIMLAVKMLFLSH